jgi:hypothetical protein
MESMTMMLALFAAFAIGFVCLGASLLMYRIKTRWPRGGVRVKPTAPFEREAPRHVHLQLVSGQRGSA